jgi:transcriptional regulator GlxA family with amidase domain
MNSFGRHLDPPFHGGLTLSKLQRTTAYIQAHLEHALSLVELAAVTQTSPTHFAHLFKQATGQTPHQYVFRCRMERAKHLLTGTTLQTPPTHPFPLWEVNWTGFLARQAGKKDCFFRD